MLSLIIFQRVARTASFLRSHDSFLGHCWWRGTNSFFFPWPPFSFLGRSFIFLSLSRSFPRSFSHFPFPPSTLPSATLPPCTHVQVTIGLVCRLSRGHARRCVAGQSGPFYTGTFDATVVDRDNRDTASGTATSPASPLPLLSSRHQTIPN